MSQKPEEKGKGVRCADAVFARILSDTPDALPGRCARGTPDPVALALKQATTAERHPKVPHNTH
ncbi:hypothetical protein [Ruegeria sp. Ofav3-42]|uniref:hypothetical protein n=1 Tax=Ruegeria sp. Ofav3-42 TaxID=2917759 RepID=UPI001EF66F7B|nr:hypothetical protein [Ruegeria sp. Ofav3-42]MCG7518814.1 hypothetical protein [Ruegeria sp. Ofav3-42]